MSADWPEFQLGSRCLVKSSKRIFAKEYVEDGIPFFRSKDVIDKSLGSFSDYDLFISEDRYLELKEMHGSPEKGDVLISSVGNRSGQPYVVQDEGDFYFKDGNILWLSKFEDINSDFLAYWFKSDVGQEILASVMIGSAQKALTIDAIKKLWVKFPLIGYQNKATEILKSFDSKIQLNRQINQTLEQIAQAIFKSWFVVFEPVQAKIEAKQNGLNPEREAMRAISGKIDAELDQLTTNQRKLLATTAALFPDELVESKMGSIPKGWEVSSIGREFNVIMGQSPPGHTYNEKGEGVPFFQGRRDFGWRYPVNRVFCTAPKRFAQKNDILLSVRAPVGDVNVAARDCCIGRGLAALRHRLGCESYTYYLMKILEQQFNNYDKEGTVFGSINQKDLRAIKVVNPIPEILKSFSNITKSLDRRIQNITKQSLILAELRDALLPKLLSDQIDILGNKEKE